MANINVNYTKLAAQAKSISEGLTDLDNAVNRAAAAGASAVAAGGGTGTGVGKAIQDSIADFPTSQYETAKKVINDLVAAMSAVSSTYSKADSNLIEQINAIKTKADALVANQNNGGNNPSTNYSYNQSYNGMNYTSTLQ